MWDLRLNAIRAFAAVYRYGGVRSAARRLGISHSSVSRHLIALETWLGVALVQGAGGRRQLTFTPQGHALGEAAVNGLGSIALVVRSLREARSSASVMIGAPSSFAVRWLLPRLPAFEESNRPAEVSVVVDQRIDGLENGDVDLAIWMGERRSTEALQWSPLMDDELYPVMSPELWNDSGRPSEPDALLGLRLLHDRDPQASWSSWQSAHGPEALDTRTGPRFTSTDLVLRAAVQGRGVALARHRLAADEIEAGLLVRPIQKLSVELGTAYWIVLPRNRLSRDVTMAVVEWLKEQAGETGSPSPFVPGGDNPTQG